MMAIRHRDRRHGGLAAQLTGLRQDEALRFLTSREVVLDWREPIEELSSGRALIRTAANLVVRFCPQLRLLPRSTFADELSAMLGAIDKNAEPLATPGDSAIRVHLGGESAQADVTGSADGWVAYVSGLGDALPRLADSQNVLGAHAAASFVASETFKHALPLRREFVWHAPLTAYSVYEYGPVSMRAPELGAVDLDWSYLLAGAGAVGQACADVVVSSGARGELPVVDRGYVDDETNLNRSVLAIESDLDAMMPKLDLVRRRAEGSRLRIIPFQGELGDLIRAIEARERPWPSVVASALDNPDARRELQGLWPDFLFEGATGDTMAQIFRHAFHERRACLRCLHGLMEATANYEEVMALRTGMSAADIAMALLDPSRTVTEAVIEAAPPDVRAIASRHRGRDICGYLSEIEKFFGIKTTEPVLLSVSFTSYLAGVFLASELLKHSAGVPTLVASRYQIDPIVNLAPERPFAQNREATCYCVERAETITEYRTLMGEGRAG